MPWNRIVRPPPAHRASAGSICSAKPTAVCPAAIAVGHERAGSRCDSGFPAKEPRASGSARKAGSGDSSRPELSRGAGAAPAMMCSRRQTSTCLARPRSEGDAQPWSSTSTTTPRPTMLPWMDTGASGGEKTAALSMSSASRWMRSATAVPETIASGRRTAPTRARLGLRHRAAHDVLQQDRLSPPTPRLSAPEDQQISRHCVGRVWSGGRDRTGVADVRGRSAVIPRDRAPPTACGPQPGFGRRYRGTPWRIQTGFVPAPPRRTPQCGWAISKASATWSISSVPGRTSPISASRSTGFPFWIRSIIEGKVRWTSSRLRDRSVCSRFTSRRARITASPNVAAVTSRTARPAQRVRVAEVLAASSAVRVACETWIWNRSSNRALIPSSAATRSGYGIEGCPRSATSFAPSAAELHSGLSISC